MDKNESTEIDIRTNHLLGLSVYRNYKYFWVQEQKISGRKTAIYRIESRSRGGTLGTVKWYAQWRAYCFFPTMGTVWNISCLDDVNSLIQDLMDARK